jgi:hypothetical protein
MARLDPRRDANDYIEKKRVDVLFQELGTRLVFERAEDPNEFLLSVKVRSCYRDLVLLTHNLGLQVLTEMQSNAATGRNSSFFTEEDVSPSAQPFILQVLNLTSQVVMSRILLDNNTLRHV